MAIDRDLLYVFTSAELGQGEPDLGARLVELYLGVLAEAETVPAMIMFLNSAIFLTTEGSSYADVLRKIESRGTELVSCITCLSYHDRRDRLIVGREGDMKGTVDAVTRFGKVVTF